MNKFVYPFLLGMLSLPLLTLFHECGHYLLGLAFDAGPQLSFMYVFRSRSDHLTPLADFCIKAGGPLVDALCVAAGLLLLRRSSPSKAPAKTDWLALALVQPAVGHLFLFKNLFYGNEVHSDEAGMSLLLGLSIWTLPAILAFLWLPAIIAALRLMPRGYRLLPFPCMHFGGLFGCVCVALVLHFSGIDVFRDPVRAARAAAAGEAAFSAGEYDKAVGLFTKATVKDDRNPNFYSSRGNAFHRLGKFEEALKDYDTAINKVIALSGDPNDKRLGFLFYNRGYVLERAGRSRDALAEYQKVIELDPSYPDAHNNLAWILATHPDASIRNTTKALEYASLEVQRTKKESASALDTLAAAYAAEGRFEEACRHQQEAVSKAKNLSDKEQFLKRLRLYEQNEPYIESSNL